MVVTELSLGVPVRVLETGAPKGAARMAGVLLHGRARTAEEMIELSSKLDIPGIRWIVPAADRQSWYPGKFMDPVGRNEPYLTQSMEIIDQLVQEASEDGRLPADRLIVGGFSQGACLTVEYAMRYPGKAKLLLAWTGGLFGPEGTEWPIQRDQLAGSRCMITGSNCDEWVPEYRTWETGKLLSELGAQVDVHVYQGRPHEVNADEIAIARSLLLRRINC
jgi:predicted esterase